MNCNGWEEFVVLFPVYSSQLAQTKTGVSCTNCTFVQRESRVGQIRRPRVDEVFAAESPLIYSLNISNAEKTVHYYARVSPFQLQLHAITLLKSLLKFVLSFNHDYNDTLVVFIVVELSTAFFQR